MDQTRPIFDLTATGPAAPIASLVQPAAAALSLEIVRVSFGGSAGVNLQIMVEHADGTPPTVEQCTAFSRAVSEILDANEPSAEAYTLEVSSPGIDRPLTRRKDFERWFGFEARIETEELVDGQKRFVGQLTSIEDDTIILRDASHEMWVPLALVVKARLILNDRLLTATQRAA